MPMTRRDRRTLVAGAIAVLSVVLVGRGVPAWTRWRNEALDRAVMTRASLRQAEALVRAAPVRRVTLLARARHAETVQPTLLAGNTPTLAGASLAAQVSAAAGRARLRLGALQLRGDSAERGVFTRVGARGEATGDVQGLTTFLGALERGPAILSVRRLGVTQPDFSAGDDRPESLHIEFEVEGLVRTAPAASGGRR